LAPLIHLLPKIKKNPRFPRISGKNPILFALTYMTRYLDVFTSFVSVYNTTMKFAFVSASAFTVYLIYKKYRATYDQNHDTFRIEFVLVPAAILALIFNYSYTVLEVFWAFSIYVESVAILPQLFMVTKTGEAETITSHYLFCLGAYRALYIMNWVYRYRPRAILTG
jgi:ER lumen protein retaining receptor